MRKRFSNVFLILGFCFFSLANAVPSALNQQHGLIVFQQTNRPSHLTVQFTLSSNELIRSGVGPLKDLAFVTYADESGTGCISEKIVFPTDAAFQYAQGYTDSPGLVVKPAIDLMRTTTSDGKYQVEFELKNGGGYLKFFLGYGEHDGLNYKRYLAGTWPIVGPKPTCLEARTSGKVTIGAGDSSSPRILTPPVDEEERAPPDAVIPVLGEADAPSLTWLNDNFNTYDEKLPQEPSVGYNSFVSGKDFVWKDLLRPFYFPPVDLPKKNDLEQTLRFKIDRKKLPQAVPLEHAFDVLHVTVKNPERPDVFVTLMICRNGAPIPAEIRNRCDVFQNNLFYPGNDPGTFFIPLTASLAINRKPKPIPLIMTPYGVDFSPTGNDVRLFYFFTRELIRKDPQVKDLPTMVYAANKKGADRVEVTLTGSKYNSDATSLAYQVTSANQYRIRGPHLQPDYKFSSQIDPGTFPGLWPANVYFYDVPKGTTAVGSMPITAVGPPVFDKSKTGQEVRRDTPRVIGFGDSLIACKHLDPVTRKKDFRCTMTFNGWEIRHPQYAAKNTQGNGLYVPKGKTYTFTLSSRTDKKCDAVLKKDNPNLIKVVCKHVFNYHYAKSMTWRQFDLHNAGKYKPDIDSPTRLKPAPAGYDVDELWRTIVTVTGNGAPLSIAQWFKAHPEDRPYLVSP